MFGLGSFSWELYSQIIAPKGLCQYVLKTVKDAKYRGIVIGYDHRHNSERFARLTAAAFLREGVKVYLHRGIVHTPLLVS